VPTQNTRDWLDYLVPQETLGRRGANSLRFSWEPEYIVRTFFNHAPDFETATSYRTIQGSGRRTHDLHSFSPYFFRSLLFPLCWPITFRHFPWFFVDPPATPPPVFFFFFFTSLPPSFFFFFFFFRLDPLPIGFRDETVPRLKFLGPKDSCAGFMRGAWWGC